jgi:hypothetical protein
MKLDGTPAWEAEQGPNVLPLKPTYIHVALSLDGKLACLCVLCGVGCYEIHFSYSFPVWSVDGYNV